MSIDGTVKHDWSRADAMTEEEVHVAAMADPDARPISDEEFARARRVSRARLYLQHPEEAPEVTGSLPYLIHPPSKLASSDSWRSFRDRTLLPMIQERPADRNLPNFLKQVEAVLAWRAAVPGPDRFWKPDADQKA